MFLFRFNPLPHLFNPAPAGLLVQAFLPGDPGRPGWSAGLVFSDCLQDEFLEPFPGFLNVFLSGSAPARLDDHNPSGVYPPVSESKQSLLARLGQRRGLDVKKKMDSRGNLVHILPARSPGPDSLKVQL